MGDSKEKLPVWQASFRELQLQSEPGKLLDMIHKTEKAIFERLQQLQQESDATGEQGAIRDALKNLRIIKRDKLGFPDWK